jgi:hypothetical protein
VTMHRQDYQLIAKGLVQARSDLDEFSRAVADHIANCIANTLASNPRFDRALFPRRRRIGIGRAARYSTGPTPTPARTVGHAGAQRVADASAHATAVPGSATTTTLHSWTSYRARDAIRCLSVSWCDRRVQRQVPTRVAD